MIAFVVSVMLAAAQAPAACREWHECRQLALEAYARREYEQFHDLAWRTVQTGPPRDGLVVPWYAVMPKAASRWARR